MTSFLTKKEQLLINLIKVNSDLSPTEKERLIEEVNYVARLRQDGYRKPVRIFLTVLSNMKTDRLALSLRK